MDCILLVGNRESYRVVADESNKAFLKLAGRHILHIMLEELRKVDEIDRILLVGSKQRLEQLLATIYSGTYPKPLQVFEQRQDLIQNAMTPFEATNQAQDPNRYVLVLPSDIPLLTAAEVREFITLADMTTYDFVTGLITAETLARFAPEGDKPGVKMVCFTMASGRYRANNMHLIRPTKIQRMDYVRRLYNMRYQLKFTNGLKLMYTLASSGVGLMGVLFYFGMRLCNTLHNLGWMRAHAMVARCLKLKTAEEGISKILGARYHCAVTGLGGTTIDVDNDQDYQTLCQRYEEWRSMLQAATDKAKA